MFKEGYFGRIECSFNPPEILSGHEKVVSVRDKSDFVIRFQFVGIAAQICRFSRNLWIRHVDAPGLIIWKRKLLI